MNRRNVAVAAVVCVVGLIVVSPARAQTPSVEEQLLALINTARSHPVVMHAGLRDAARRHSEAMARAGKLNHNDSRNRVYNAAPDPPEKNGPPDHGFTGTWCEVAGWEPAGTEAGTARRFFDDWIQSAQDNQCMTDTPMTVAGVGVYQSSGRWWATLEMVQDRTPPTEGRSERTPAAASPAAGAAATPIVSRAPANAERSQSSGSENAASSRTTQDTSSKFGLREILVAVAGFSIVPILYATRRRAARRRAAGV